MGKHYFQPFLTALLLIVYTANATAVEDGKDQGAWGVSLDYKFQSWEPDDIFGANVLTTGLNLIGLQLGTGGNTSGFNPVLRYEIAPGEDSAAQEELVQLADDEASGWERLFADLKWTFDSGSSFSIIFDRQIYLTSVQTNRDYWYFDGGNVTLLIPGDIVRNSTVMEDLQLLYGSPLLQYGIYSLSYEKPFSTDIQNGQIGIYRTELKSVGFMLKSEHTKGIVTIGGSYKFGLVSDLTIGASSSAAALLGEFDDSLDFSEFALSVEARPYRGFVDISIGVDYKIRSMSGDIQLTRDDISSLYINLSKSF